MSATERKASQRCGGGSREEPQIRTSSRSAAMSMRVRQSSLLLDTAHMLHLILSFCSIIPTFPMVLLLTDSYRNLLPSLSLQLHPDPNLWHITPSQHTSPLRILKLHAQSSTPQPSKPLSAQAHNSPGHLMHNPTRFTSTPKKQGTKSCRTCKQKKKRNNPKNPK